MVKRPCSEPGCPVLTTTTRCLECARRRDRERGTRQERGYDAEYDQLKRTYAKRVQAGELLLCVRCHQPITGAVTPDHNATRDGYLGPAHPRCNLSAAGKASRLST